MPKASHLLHRFQGRATFVEAADAGRVRVYVDAVAQSLEAQELLAEGWMLATPTEWQPEPGLASFVIEAEDDLQGNGD